MMHSSSGLRGPVRMAPTPRLTVRVEGTTTGIREAVSAFDRFEGEHGLTGEATWPMRVALDEVLSNIVRHGGAGKRCTVVDVRFGLVRSALVVTVIDDGPELDPLALPQPDTRSGLAERQPGGLGLHIMKQLMDRVEYARQRGRNRLVLMRRLDRVAGSERRELESRK
jgi:serine/threonine-protein kinase RsbW